MSLSPLKLQLKTALEAKGITCDGNSEAITIAAIKYITALSATPKVIDEAAVEAERDNFRESAKPRSKKK